VIDLTISTSCSYLAARAQTGTVRKFMVINVLLNHKFLKMKKLSFAGLLCLFVTAMHAQQQQTDSLNHFNINEVIVSATRNNSRLKESPQKIEIINKTSINAVPSDNVADLLKKTTNLDIIQYPGVSSSFGMRGFSPSAHSRSYTLILINGVPTATTNAASIGISEIERIEIIKGPYSTLYGSDAMGGVINIITKETPLESNGQVSLSAGTFGQSRFSGSAGSMLSHKTGFTMAITRNEQLTDYRIGKKNILTPTETEKHILDKNSYGDVMINSKFRTHQASGQVSHVVSPQWKTRLDAIYYVADDIETPGNYWGSYGQSKKDINRLNLIGNISGELQRHSISLSPYMASENTRNYSNNSQTGFVSLDSEVRELGFKLHDNLQIGSFTLLTGADFDLHQYQSERYSDKSTPIAPYRPDHSNRKAAFLLQLTYTKQNLILNAGNRFDHIRYEIEANDLLGSEKGDETYNSLTPTMGFRYKLPANFTIKSSHGYGFSVPDAFKVAGYYSVSEYFPAWDFWWVKDYRGNPDLKPEKSRTTDIGASYSQPKGLLEMDITWFMTVHNDKIIEYTDADKITSYKNADRSNHEGIELMATSDLGALFSNRFKLELFANFTWMLKSTFDETKTDTDGNKSTITRDMLYIRNSNGSFGIHYNNLGGFSTRVNGRYIGHRLEKDSFAKLRPDIVTGNYYQKGGYSTSDKVLKLPRHIVFDWSVFYTHQQNKKFGISISNLLDENYTEKDGYNMPGRMLTGQFTYLFL
jgi:vitamin B12 transporter